VTGWPADVERPDQRAIAAGLRSLGLRSGQDVLVHCSMRSLGLPRAGGATVLAAIREVIGDATVVVPAQTPDNSTTSEAFRRRTGGGSAAEVARAERSIPGFDPERSPSVGMGWLAEYVRRQPGAVRSRHPQTSFAALGTGAADLMSVHDLDCHLGERSPLAKLDTRRAMILLLGVDWSVCTALHLAEYRLPGERPTRAYRCYVSVDGRRERRDFTAQALSTHDFPALGEALDGWAPVRRARIGPALCRSVRVDEAVSFALLWMTEHRCRARQ